MIRRLLTAVVLVVLIVVVAVRVNDPDGAPRRIAARAEAELVVGRLVVAVTWPAGPDRIAAAASALSDADGTAVYDPASATLWIDTRSGHTCSVRFTDPGTAAHDAPVCTVR